MLYSNVALKYIETNGNRNPEMSNYLLPIALLLFLAVAGVTVWLVKSITRPPQQPYLVTPATFAQLSSPLKATDETWPNRDGTTARGWLRTAWDFCFRCSR